MANETEEKLLGDVMEAIAETEGLGIVQGGKVIKEGKKAKGKEKPGEEEPKPDEKKPEEQKKLEEGKPEDKKPEEQAAEWATPDWMKELALDFKSKDEAVTSLKELLQTRQSKTELDSELEKLRKEHDTVRAENQQLKDLYDPKKMFVSDAEEVRQKLLRKYPDYDASTITTVLTADIDKMSPLQAVRLKEMLTDRDSYGSEGVLDEYLADHYDIEAEKLSKNELEDITAVNQVKLNKEAKEAKALFKKIKTEIEKDENDITNKIKTEREQRELGRRKAKDDWAKFSNQLGEHFKEVSIPVKGESGDTVFKYTVDEEFRKTLSAGSEKVAEALANRGLDYTRENVGQVLVELQNNYINSHFGNILEQYAKDKIAEAIKKQDEELSNPLQKKAEPDKQGLTKAEQEIAHVEAQINKLF
jgi:hypothetical protein